jgi:hypothetical protein
MFVNWKIIIVLVSFHLAFNPHAADAKMTSSMMDSILLINLSDLGTISEKPSKLNRRAAVDENTLTSELDGENALNPPPSSSTTTPFSSFEATHELPLETNPALTLALSNAFSPDGAPPSYEDFKGSIENLSSKKDDFGLSNRSFLSATKSLISAYLQVGGQFDQESSLPLALYLAILPKIELWGGNVSHWVKNVAKISVEAYLENDLGITELSPLASSFATATVDLISERTPPEDPNANEDESEPMIPNLNFDYLEENDDITLEDKLNLGENYSPTKTAVLQQLSVGISQGYFGFTDAEGGLSKGVFTLFAKPSSKPSPINDGQIEPNIITGFFNGLMDSATKLGETKEVFLYDSVKASANGFLIATTVASTSNPEYLDQFLYLDAAEMVSKQVSQSVLLHGTENNDLNNPSISYSAGTDWIDADRVAESAASGAAMGSQLATVLPKSLDYTASWEIATNIRRDVAKSVARGSSAGAVNSASWLGSVISSEDAGKTVLTGNDIEKVARGSSLGSMVGNTGLAIYYPTDQLVPIINLTAQGSAYGSTNSDNLALVKSDSIETIDIGVARQSALGSAMGAIFEPTVLLGLNPAQSSNEKDTIDHLTAATFGATFGAILGLQDNEVEIISRNGSSQFDESRVVEVQQATKQGSIEGALAGAKLSLGLDEVNSETLKSKTVMLKAVNSANTKAAANSTSNVANQSLRTNSQDMLLLMKKFGINPRYTNPAKMYKRPVIVQVDEPPIDDDSSEAINNASPL